MFPIVGWTVFITTAPPMAPPGTTFTAQVNVTLENNRTFQLRVDSVDELNIIVALLQNPTGRVFLNPSTLQLQKIVP